MERARGSKRCMGRLVPGDTLIGLSATQIVRRFLGIGLGLVGWGVFRLLASRPEMASILVGIGPDPRADAGSFHPIRRHSVSDC